MKLIMYLYTQVASPVELLAQPLQRGNVRRVALENAAQASLRSRLALKKSTQTVLLSCLALNKAARAVLLGRLALKNAPHAVLLGRSPVKMLLKPCL